ncbi:MAG: dephospho-CoA kinase [Planctomycetota bacterium]|jgi:dephospho-CoA kinase
MARPTVVIGLTGGIGSGKSAAASIFREMGARVVDADAIGHRVLGEPAVRRALARAFGEEVLHGGRIDRAAVARRAFAGPASVRRLNRIVHPRIRREVVRRLNAARRRGGPVVLDAALLMEKGSDRFCDVLVYVDAARKVRTRRLKKRGWSPGELRRRENAQWPAGRKRARADYIIRNGGSRAALRAQVGGVLRKILSQYQEESCHSARAKKPRPRTVRTPQRRPRGRRRTRSTSG